MDWTVTLVSGAAGVGKSRVAAGLASLYGVPLTQVDDVVTALVAMTDPDQQPALHYWSTHPEAREWGPEQIAEHHLRVADELSPAVMAVIADHIEFGEPIILEGDYLLPEQVEPFSGEARAVVVSEPDTDQLIANLRAREPGVPAQSGRVRVSRLVEGHLAVRASDLGVALVAARPWGTVVERADRALRNLG